MIAPDDYLDLHGLLCRLFRTTEEIRRVTEEAFDDAGSIDFNGDVRTVWERVLDAIRSRKRPDFYRALCNAARVAEPGGQAEELLRRLAPSYDPDDTFEWRSARSPFRGLKPYEVHHAAAFYGRDEQVRDVLERLDDEGKVIVSGEAGAGKSSLAMAGVLARLVGPTSAVLKPGRRTFVAVVFRPGPNPWEALAAALEAAQTDPHPEGGARWSDRVGAQLAAARRGGTPSALWDLLQELTSDAHGAALLVDQMEEIVSYGVKSDHREAFLGMLAFAFAQPFDPRIRILGTIRTDSLALLQGVASWRAADLRLNEIVYPLPPADSATFGAILAAVEARFHVRSEASLLRAITRDAGQTAVSLPLASFVLDALWRGIEHHQMKLTYAAYVELGGIRGAIDGVMSRFWDALPEADRATSERVIRYLVDLTPGGPVRTRRVRRTELREALGVDRGHLDATLERLLEQRVLVASAWKGEDLVELTHDALLRNWRGFEAIVARARQSIEDHTALREAVAHHRQPGNTGQVWRWRDKRTVRVNAASARTEMDLTGEERDFLRSCRRHHRAVIAAGLLAALAVTSVFYLTWHAKGRAERDRNTTTVALDKAKNATNEAAVARSRAQRAEASLADFVYRAAAEGFLRTTQSTESPSWVALLDLLRSPAPPPGGSERAEPREHLWRRGRMEFAVADLFTRANDSTLFSRAEALLLAARARFESVLRAPPTGGADPPTNCDLHVAIARCNCALGILHQQRGELDRAARSLEAAIAHLDGDAAATCPASPSSQVELWRVQALADLGTIYAESGDLPRAAATFVSARATSIPPADEDPALRARVDLRLAATQWGLGQAVESHLRVARLLTRQPAATAAAPPPRCLDAGALPVREAPRRYLEMLLRDTELPPQAAMHRHHEWDADTRDPQGSALTCRVSLRGPLSPGLCFPRCRIDVSCRQPLAAYERVYACVECAIDRGRDTIIGRDPDPYETDGDGPLEFDTAARCLVLSDPDGHTPRRFTLRPVVAPQR